MKILVVQCADGTIEDRRAAVEKDLNDATPAGVLCVVLPAGFALSHVIDHARPVQTECNAGAGKEVRS